ncbi:hypothetical protein PFISCL1PPCAC_28495 [Pristionchus fissidentatus]|uniref:Uncharacterized protein n=1 Tax=Pristionchus fissidentatus TaxID=1538716 RepID=A0AAV5X3A6_9BILA|nr:hypothetical protein PFISCL1PPCAC_25200 [Pristionchus fissidentatus]GMT37198.1 hypothetical protein PFISCL1PPCAC_28495 [Pristionchus fissidentatus]
MSVWTEDSVPVRRSSRRQSLQPSDVESIISSASTPSRAEQRKLLIPKSSLIPPLKEIDERMQSSEDELFALATPATEKKKGRGRPRKSPARNMTAIKTPSISIIAVKEAAAAATPAAKREKTPPRSRSSSRARKTAATPAKSKIVPVLNFDDESPALTRRSTRLAGKTTTNGHTNGSTVQDLPKEGAATPRVSRRTTEEWRQVFTKDHPFVTSIVIPALICLFYAMVIMSIGYYFDVHRKAPVWMDTAAKNINGYYDDFMARRAAAAAAEKAAEAAASI